MIYNFMHKMHIKSFFFPVGDATGNEYHLFNQSIESKTFYCGTCR